MPKLSLAGQITSIINKLKAERKKHADALRSLDDVFEKIGLTTHLAEEQQKPRPGRPPGKRRPGRPPKAKGTTTAAKKGRRGRGKFRTTGSDSILMFVKQAGSKGVMGAEIGKHWKAEGRGAGVYVVIGKLVKAKKLKRENVKGERGSRYTAA